MYRKLFYIAFLIFTLSQVTNAKTMKHCYMCDQLGACSNTTSSSSNQFLTININKKTTISEPFAILATSSKKIFNIFRSCDTNSTYLETWTREQLHNFAQSVKANLNNKIAFSKGTCVTVKEIMKNVTELNEKLNALKNGIDVLRINITGPVWDDKYGLRRAGKRGFQIFENCVDKKKPKLYFNTIEKAQHEFDKTVQRSTITIEILLGSEECKPFTEIVTTIKNKMIEMYPEQADKINKTVAPASPASTAEGVMKVNYVYMKVEKCDSTRKRENWDDAEEKIKTWVDNYIKAMALTAD